MKKKCLYCDNLTSDDPHFESQCCGRGMCDECYDNLQGTDEQVQVDYMNDEDFEKVKDEFKDASYLCFECSDIWEKKDKKKLNKEKNNMKYKAIIELRDIPKMDERELPEHFENHIKEHGIIEDQIELIEESPMVKNVADILKRFNKMDEEDRVGDFSRIEFLLNEFAYFFEDQDKQFNETKFRRQVLGIK